MSGGGECVCMSLLAVRARHASSLCVRRIEYSGVMMAATVRKIMWRMYVDGAAMTALLIAYSVGVCIDDSCVHGMCLRMVV